MKVKGRTEVIVIRVSPKEKEAIRNAMGRGWDEPEGLIAEARTFSRYLRVLALKNIESKKGKKKGGKR